MKLNTIHPLTYLVWRTVRDAGSISSDAVAEKLPYLSEKRVRNNLYNLRLGGMLTVAVAPIGKSRVFSIGPVQPRCLDLLEEKLASNPIYLGLQADPRGNSKYKWVSRTDDTPPPLLIRKPKPDPHHQGAAPVAQPRQPDRGRPWNEPYMAQPVRAGSLDFARCASVRAGGRLVHCYQAVTATTTGDSRA